MAATFRLKVVTPDEVFYEGEVTYVQAPGGQGSLGILANHAPLITTINEGALTYRDATGEKQFSIEGGFLEVLKNRVLVLTDKISKLQESAD